LEKKILENLFQTIFGTENTQNTTTFVGCFIKLNFIPQNSVSFHLVPNYEFGSFDEHGIPWNEHFFLRNNKNHSESIPQNKFGTKF
jgi:hypothetical protein